MPMKYCPNCGMKLVGTTDFGESELYVDTKGQYYKKPKKTKRKLSAWNKFVKANAKKPRFRLRSGSPNLKKLGVAFRKTPAGRKKKR
jgi:hypothetical protein